MLISCAITKNLQRQKIYRLLPIFIWLGACTPSSPTLPGAQILPPSPIISAEISSEESIPEEAITLLPANASILPSLQNVTGFQEYCTQKLQRIQKRFSALSEEASVPGPSRFLRSLDEMLLALDNLAGISGLYTHVHPQGEMRSSAEKCMQNIQKLSTEIGLSRPLYEQVANAQFNQEDLLQKRYQERLLRGFRRSGVDRDEQTQQRLRQLKDEILRNGQDFSRNIRNDVRYVSISDAGRLAGLPQDWMEARTPDANGTIRISTDYPDYLPVMQYAEDDALRLELYRAFRSRGHPANRTVLLNLLKNRAEMARLLAYSSYAAYDTEEKMIRNPEQAQIFIDRINALARPLADREYEELLQELGQVFPDAQTVGDWQKSWLSGRIKKRRFNVDPQEVRLYFRYQRVRDGIFRLAEKLFAIQISPWEAETWHPSVESYIVSRGEQILGRFYLDMHPRANKYKHAAHFGIRTGVSVWQLPVAALVCNFPEADHPHGGRMEHRQVETFLHEFGHLMHSILGGNQPWSTLSGIATEHDFVEAPSQMLEEWVWDYETLSEFARNDADELIPPELVAKMNRARNLGRGLWTRNQMFYAAFSLHLYKQDPQLLHLDKDMQALQEQYSPFAYVEDTAFYSSFGHLYGYAASYYTYMWSLVIAADMFEKFSTAGLYDPQTSQNYREQILEPGGSQDAARLVQNFLGRNFSFDAFIKQLNQNGESAP